jgi:hypothetical protein
MLLNLTVLLTFKELKNQSKGDHGKGRALWITPHGEVI